MTWQLREYTVKPGEMTLWIIGYDGPKTWQQAEADYYGSPERKALDPDPARYLAQTEARLMTTA